MQTGGSGGDGGRDAAGDASLPCQTSQALSGGTACAVIPSSTDAGVHDVPDPGSSNEYHAVAFPDGSDPTTPMYVHLLGTGGVPFRPDLGEFSGSTLRIMQEGIDQGFIVMALAYPRVRGSTIYDVCLPDPLCYEPFRREMLEGIPRDPGDAESVLPPNDIMNRLEALVAHLAERAPDRLPATLDWPGLRVGGSSQGAGHVAFLAKYLRAVGRVCMLAGPGDNDIPLYQSDAGTGTPAPWLESSVWETPRDRFRGVIHEEDAFYRKTTTAWQSMGLVADRDWRVLTGTVDPGAGHGYVSGEAAEAVAARRWACFE